MKPHSCGIWVFDEGTGHVLSIIYYLYWITAVVLLVGSFMRFRHYLHPHVAFTVIVVVMFFSDFLVRGYDDQSLQGIADHDLAAYQLEILAAVVVMVGAAFIMGERWQIRKSQNDGLIQALLPWQKRIALFFGLGILALDFWKRFYLSDWSLTDAVLNSFAPYGIAPWNYSTGFLGDDKVFFQLIRTAMPLAGLLFGLLFLASRSLVKWLYLFAVVVVILLLTGEGPRTPVVIVIAGFIGLHWQSDSTIKRKILVVAIGALVIALLTSLIIQNRAEGLAQVYAGETGNIAAIEYSQDDSYYRAIRALSLSNQGEPQWDPNYFLYVIVVNPIPRFIWSDKPALQEDYYGEYKEEWVTISFMGELVAMFGRWLGLMFSVVIGILLFLLIGRSSKLLNKQGGLIMYGLILLYVYMVMRSLLNISQFVYLPGFGFVAYYMLNHRDMWKVALK
jgi:hypothetical protein